jgi:ribosomal-protein-alanine N-acetyltransferase
MRVKGDWPGLLTFRSGWAKAIGRPWNDAVPDASLRLVRGSAEFVDECSAELCRLGARSVLSPPLDRSQRSVWLAAGYRPELTLDVHSRDLFGALAPPAHAVVEGDDADWQAAVAVDDASFTDRWRMGELGLAEARDATPKSAFLVVRDERLLGFVIVGTAVTAAYLQRIAVAPDARRAGVGRSLVRAAVAWGAAQGATRIVLNTQPDNEAAARLYRDEGFECSPGALSVLARSC